MQKSIQERIKELRLTLNLSQAEFGKRIGVKQTTVAGWETGGRNPSEPIVLSMHREFGVNELWLLEGIEPMFTPPMNLDDEMMVLAAQLTKDGDDFSRIIISKYLKLSPEGKKVVKELILSIAEEYQDAKKDGSEEPSDVI